MKKIKICHFILGFHNGGVEKVLENYFSNMDRTKFELHIVTHMEPDLKRQKIFEDMGFHVHQLSYVHGHKITHRNLKEYKELFKDNKFDVVHNHFPENLLPLFFARIFKVKVRILHSHGDYKNAFRKNCLVKMAYYLGLRFNTFNTTHRMACGKRAAETVFGKKNVKDGKVKIVNNAIYTQKFRYDEKQRLEIRKKLGIKDEFVLGHVGRYEDVQQKNQGFVLDVYANVLKKIPDAKLLMLGEGKQRIEIMQQAQKMKIEKNILFTGAVSNVSEYLLAMDVFIFPSLFEGFSVATTEAQCTGLPGVMSDTVSAEMNILGTFDILSLSQPMEEWGNSVVAKRNYIREDKAEIMKKMGYDIREEAKKLEAFYCNVYSQY